MTPQVISLLNQSLQYLRNDNLQSAELFLRQALRLDTRNIDVLRLLGVVEAKRGRHFEALVFFEKAFKIAPQNGVICSNIGNVLQELKRYQDALNYYQRAIELAPDYAEAYSNCGNALQELKRYQDALYYYQRAIELAPDYAEAYSNCGNALQELRQYQEALRCYKKAFEINPDIENLLGSLVYTKMKISDWSSYEQSIQHLSDNINLGMKSATPFQVLVLCNSEELSLKAAKNFSLKWSSSVKRSKNHIRKDPVKKIRIGYFSADFHNHATSYLMAEFFELHNKEIFELIAFSFGESSEDNSRKRLIAAFNEFLDVRDLTSEEIAKLAREKAVDIAIDLKGYTEHSRPDIFFHGAAPIQVGYLGYPGGMGSECFDYVIADKTLIPPENQQFFLEKIIYLPNSYQVNDSTKKISRNELTRTDLGLPEDGFVFCCFNNNYKITPSVFDSWSNILKGVDGSVIWLLEDNVWAKENLIKEAVLRGLSPDRLVFAQRTSLEEHLARHIYADLFLDNLPCNAHTTASDALWTGLPVLTQIGDSFAGRVAASLLKAVNLADLIVESRDAYVSIAIELALNPEKLRDIKNRLSMSIKEAPLFNTQLTTRHLEEGYLHIYERCKAGLLPDHIYLKH